MKANAKTVYLRGGETVSLKRLERMGCKIALEVMSPFEVKQTKINKLNKQLSKLMGEKYKPCHGRN